MQSGLGEVVESSVCTLCCHLGVKTSPLAALPFSQWLTIAFITELSSNKDPLRDLYQTRLCRNNRHVQQCRIVSMSEWRLPVFPLCGEEPCRRFGPLACTTGTRQNERPARGRVRTPGFHPGINNTGHWRLEVGILPRNVDERRPTSRRPPKEGKRTPK